MWLKKCFGVVLVCAALINCSCLTTAAVNIDTDTQNMNKIVERATNGFSMHIPPKTAVQAKSSFSMEAGEIVTIKASYSPFSASVDFGLIEPDGTFLFVNVTDGSVDQKIEVDQRGSYTLAVRNNSSKEISVSGFVNY